MAGTKQIGEAIVRAIQMLEANGDRISKEQLIYTMNAEMKRILPNWNSSIFLQQCSITQEQIEQIEREVTQDRIVYEGLGTNNFYRQVMDAALSGMQQATEPDLLGPYNPYANAHDDQIQAMALAAEDFRRRALHEDANRAYVTARQLRKQAVRQQEREWYVDNPEDEPRLQRMNPRPRPILQQRDVRREEIRVVVCPDCEIGYAHTDTTQCHHCLQYYCNGCVVEHIRAIEMES